MTGRTGSPELHRGSRALGRGCAAQNQAHLYERMGQRDADEQGDAKRNGGGFERLLTSPRKTMVRQRALVVVEFGVAGGYMHEDSV